METMNMCYSHLMITTTKKILATNVTEEKKHIKLL